MSIPCGFGKTIFRWSAYRRELLHRGEDAERRPQYQKATDWHKREPAGIQA